MKKRIISYITFGLLLIALGIIGTFLKWAQARVFLGMGFLFELLAVLFLSGKRSKISPDFINLTKNRIFYD